MCTYVSVLYNTCSVNKYSHMIFNGQLNFLFLIIPTSQDKCTYDSCTVTCSEVDGWEREMDEWW